MSGYTRNPIAGHYSVTAVEPTADPPGRYTCRRCGHPYPWRGGISFGAVCDLGRLVREHYETAHPGIEANR